MTSATRTDDAGLRVASFDGLRGIGMILVLMRHVILDLPRDAEHLTTVAHWTSPFNSAMDMFFVLSGFLITGLLYDSRERPDYFRTYFARRCLRIFPLYYFALIVAFWIIPALPLRLPPDYDLLVDNQAWYWTYTTNFLIATTRGQGTPLNTGHLWSLSVEEQFYLVWPFLLYFLGRRGIVRLCVACIAGGMLFRLGLHVYFGATGVYVLAPGRVDQLAIGGLLAVFCRDPGGFRALVPWCKRLLVASAAVMAIIIWDEGELNRRDPGNYLIGYTATAVFYAAAIGLLAAFPQSRASRLIGLRPFTHLGRHSYAMYIVHYPLLAVLVAVWPAQPLIEATGGSAIPALLIYSAILFAVSYLLAMLLWVAIERPFLNLKRYFPAPAAVRLDPVQVDAPSPETERRTA